MAQEARTSSDGVGPAIRIEILLREYSSLRSELLLRGVQASSISLAGLAGLIWFVNSLLVRPTFLNWSNLLLIAVVLGSANWSQVRDMSRLASRIRQIEHQVNRIAGEQLLEWESKWGLLSLTYTERSLDQPAVARGPISLGGWIALLVGGTFAVGSAIYYLPVLYEWARTFLLSGLTVERALAASQLSPQGHAVVDISTKTVVLAFASLFVAAVFIFCATVVLRPDMKPTDKLRAWDMIKILSGFVVGISTNMINAS